MLFKFFTLHGLATAASAHMIMSHPVPFGNPSNGPLALEGSNFPCQGPVNFKAATQVNTFAQGSTQPLNFTGSAVHGGGSCQISVTTDLQPSKSSVWRVIKSIEGGCPAMNQVGNMGSNPSFIDPYGYHFTIPAQLQAGNYVLAWTWFNKIGNREMYMNCAPLTVTGYGGSASFLDTLPKMFEANIFGEQGCRTEDSKDIIFPDPGNDVDFLNISSSAWATGCASTAGNNQPTPVSTAPGFVPTYSSPSLPTGYPAISPAPAVPAPPSRGAVFITAPTDRPAPTRPIMSEPVVTSVPVPGSQAPAPAPTSATGITAAPVRPSAPAPAPPAPPAPTSGSGSGSGSSSSGGFAPGSPCANEGDWNCIDGNSFQRCGSGVWSTAISMAAGVSCAKGQDANLTLVVKKSKRNLRHGRRALHAAHAHSHS